jgi:hypothetical protein
MPYGIIFLVATVVLAVRYVRSSGPSDRSKHLVGSLAAFAVLAPYLWPRFLPLAGVVALMCLFLQFSLSLCLVLHQMWRESAERT